MPTRRPLRAALLSLLLGPALATAAEVPSARQIASQFLMDSGLSAAQVQDEFDALPVLRHYNNDLAQESVLMRPRYAVDGPEAGLYLAVVQNISDEKAWCIRTKGTVRGPAISQLVVSEVNQLVGPGGHTPIMVASVGKDGAGQFHYEDRIATTFWRPDLSAPDGFKCRSTAPDKLDAWLADPGYRSYPDFLDSLAITQDDLDNATLSDEALQDVFDLEPVDDE